MNKIVPGPVLTITVMAALAALTLACGSTGESDGEVAASATALRREQAIATFTAEASLEPTATSFAVATPTLLPRATATSGTTPTAVNPTPTSAESGLADQQLRDTEAIRVLLRARADAMVSADFDAWYETCASQVRAQAREVDALGKQLRALQLDLDQNSSVEFVLEQVFFTGSTAATVVWGWREGTSYFQGVGGGPFIKEGDAWFSIGWGCAG